MDSVTTKQLHLAIRVAQEHLKRALVVPVRDDRAYLKTVQRALGRHVKGAAEFSKVMKSAPDILEPYLERLAGGTRVWAWWDSDWVVKDLMSSFSQYMSEPYGLGTFAKYLLSPDSKRDQMLGLARSLESRTEFISELKEAELYPVDPRWEDETVGDRQLKPLFESAEHFVAFFNVIEAFQKKVQANPALQSTMHVQDVETLYHVSVNAKALASPGFSKTMPKEDSGLGLGGSQSTKGGGKGISFTYDRNSAREMYRLIRELHSAATGKIKAPFVLDAVRRSKNPDWIWSEFGKGPEGLKTPLDVAELYYHYTMVGGDRGKIWILNVRKFLQNLAKVSQSNIGILVAEVDMNYPGVTLLSGEREVRVPPDAILRIKKLIQ